MTSATCKVTISCMEFFKKVIKFIKDVANDERIPSSDKKKILVLAALIVSPVDLIPDWIPVIGILDDLLMLALILDYFFEKVDSQVLLSHYPFGMKSFATMRRLAGAISWITPNWLRNKLWSYQGNIYND